MTAFRGPLRPPVGGVEAPAVAAVSQDPEEALMGSACPSCGAGKKDGYFFCRKCACTLPGGVLHDLIYAFESGMCCEVRRCFDRAMEVLR